MKTWLEYETILPAALEVARNEGYYRGVSGVVSDQTRPHVQSDAGEILQSELLAFVARQSSKITSGERVLGSTEVLESSFGRWKSLEGDHQKGGLHFVGLGLRRLARRYGVRVDRASDGLHAVEACTNMVYDTSRPDLASPTNGGPPLSHSSATKPGRHLTPHNPNFSTSQGWA